jgi:pimeloyl-ACP methyl ester carboxylesterase/UDP:flavonoid glycosyltransferase YjiC (YdhE family)
VNAVRAREPDQCGYAVRDGVRLYYEVAGSGPTTVLLLPAWAIVHSRIWKMQVPYLARHFRVVTFDPRGNGRSDRPPDPDDYADTELVADAIAVLDATGTDVAVGVGLSMGAGVLLRLAVAHRERIAGAVFLGPAVGLGSKLPERWRHPFDEELDTDEGWAKYNARYWERDLAGFAKFFFGEVFPEAHSTKAIEDAVGWALETDPKTLAATARGPYLAGDAGERGSVAAGLAAQVTCPSLVIHGANDRIVGGDSGAGLAAALGCDLELFIDGGHCVHVRHPVQVNTVVRRFVESLAGGRPSPPRETPWLFARERKRRALWVCSPIGLGHVLRDLAIARSLRDRVPDLEIHWWAQPPVTGVLEAAGEVIHPASTELASESAHWESESAHHDLHAFHAFRRMDEIFCANYMLFDDVVRETPYDLWVGDESWEVDHFLHENPERKIAPYAFLTDVIGFLPVDPSSDPSEAELCADYNAEMIEHLARFPYVRDRSMFIGGFGELPDASFGPGLPRIRDWSEQWFTSVPYVVPFDPSAYRRPATLRAELGYGTGFPLYVAAVGGTAVGRDLLELTAEAFALLRKDQPDARMVMVTGPRLHPGQLPDVEGMDKHGYVPALFEHLACADVAVVQGGLSTTMELVAARRPFVYFPLAHHWEQQHFVAHRLDHYRAGIRMDFATTTPADLAAAMLSAYGRRPAYRSVPRGGAAKAAGQLATLLRR